MSEQDGRVPLAPGSIGSADEAASRLRPSGDDPSRIAPWPENNQPLEFEQISRPIIHAIRFAYSLQRRNKRKNIPWRGPEIGHRDRSCSPTVTERFKAHRLAYAEDDQGRDALEEIVAAAIQLGIEQGRRLARSDASELLDEFSGANFTVSVGWDDWTHVRTQAGLRSDPVRCLNNAIAALACERDSVSRCPREKYLRDSDTRRMAETGTGSVRSTGSAGRQASPEPQHSHTDNSNVQGGEA